MREDLLIVLVRSPREGAVKTRLVPPLTLLQASAAYAAMLMDTEGVIRSLPSADAWFACDGPPSESLVGSLSPGTRIVEQVGAGRGPRLLTAFTQGFAAGYRHVAALFADTPDLPPSYIETAFDRLREDSEIAAFGPALDGGYYLVGLSRPRPELFHCIPWHEPTAWQATRAGAAREGIPVAILPRWQDVDTFADLTDCLARGRAVNLIALKRANLLEPSSRTVLTL